MTHDLGLGLVGKPMVDFPFASLGYPMVKTVFSVLPRLDTISECDGQRDGRTDRQTDGRTDGFAIAHTAFAMLTLRRAVKHPRKKLIMTLTKRKQITKTSLTDRHWGGRSGKGEEGR